jgi:hypothetical protein
MTLSPPRLHAPVLKTATHKLIAGDLLNAIVEVRNKRIADQRGRARQRLPQFFVFGPGRAGA